MKYFTKDFAAFFKELEKNNDRDWFQSNKKRYEESVKEPFNLFVGELISRLSDIYQDMAITPKDAIFRIYRDVRFSKDKTPYKIHASALISTGGKKDKTRPGMYIQANHMDVRAYSGSHMLDKDQLQNVRSHIASNLNEFNKLISAKKFVDTFGEVHGEKNKRLPPEFADIEQKQPLIANKSFYYFFKLKPGVLVKDDLVGQLITSYKNALPLNRFLEEAL